MEELRVYNTIDSTNVEAHRLLTNPSIIAHGTTLVAHAQTGGKGQFGRHWHAEPNQHLAMSVILKPESATAGDLPLISKLVSLAIVTALKEADPSLHPLIKWPNDIYINGKKVAGILIENTLAGNRIQHIIAGIGINVNELAFPPELPNAISLRMITNKEFDILAIAISIRDAILARRRYGVRGGEKFPMLHSEGKEQGNFEGVEKGWPLLYREHLFKLNKMVTFDHRGSKLDGIVQDVDEHGRLVLRIGDQLQSYNTHELTWII